MSEQDAAIRSWLEGFRRGLASVEKQLSLASWAANTESSDENEKKMAEADEAYRRFLADPQRYEECKAFDSGAVRNPFLSREVDVVQRLLLANRLDEDTIQKLVPLSVEVESAYNNFRANLGGRTVPDNELRDILRQSTSSDEVRQAWEASKQIGGLVHERVRELARVRNKIARKAGYDNYHMMSLELSELEPGHLFDLLQRLADDTAEPFRKIKAELDTELAAKFSITEDELRPWHYGDPFFQSSPKSNDVDLDRFYEGKNLEELSSAFFESIGLDISLTLEQSDLYEREQKCQHAFCTHIDRSGDVRVLCNCRSNEEWMGTMLHEFGHAVYDELLSSSLPFTLREPAHILTTEAIAMLFGRLSRDAEFLVQIAGADRDEADAVAAQAREELRRNEIVFVRWALVVVFFERALYSDPEQDLDNVWWDLVEDLQLLKRPEGRQAPDWASKIHVATVPAYYQNYILGELTASQLQSYILGEILDDSPTMIGHEAVGRFLREEFFSPGNGMPWRELISTSTCEELNPAHFIAEFGE